jgi:hypothetical protein
MRDKLSEALSLFPWCPWCCFLVVGRYCHAVLLKAFVSVLLSIRPKLIKTNLQGFCEAYHLNVDLDASS